MGPAVSCSKITFARVVITFGRRVRERFGDDGSVACSLVSRTACLLQVHSGPLCGPFSAIQWTLPARPSVTCLCLSHLARPSPARLPSSPARQLLAFPPRTSSRATLPRIRHPLQHLSPQYTASAARPALRPPPSPFSSSHLRFNLRPSQCLSSGAWQR